ncbi:c-type cytochrome [Legionella anisa]|uniref:Cytochrome C n=1 Tax=Legionella anisa TaxID=28082 RepID=A0AAX0WVQ0_9GAMM|nr:c-type cytochrome [Legionella anisa]AWN74991.1 cytochrome C [Legionella anisa]KTC67334.1 putative Cytochrome c, class I precursor [Legionella anisa]MBN5933997.1 c-type cytochrome [Legionella anisa]MCW8424806.1 c-type cytochrome [Legionella anisa]MCW8446075.1 c-type cytochrome [Legionella anisa]
MKNLLAILLCAICTSVLADDLGKNTYEITCQNCHAPQFAIGMKAPAAFDKKAWNTRFKNAELEVKKNPTEYKTAMDYLLYSMKRGKGLMPHGGLCKEADVPKKNCSDAAFVQAINYMSQN